MSHFSVLVVGDNVEEQLQPYHEFECTGDSDEYVQEVDQTAEARATYLQDTTTRYRDPEGGLHDPYINHEHDPRYWRDPTEEETKKIGPIAGSGGGDGLRWASCDWKDGRGYSTRVFELPAGWTEVEVPTPEIQTFADFCEHYYERKIVLAGQPVDLQEKHKYGYVVVDSVGEVVRVVDRTNPEAKWDWWQVGGRWTGYFKLKPTAIGTLGVAGLNRMDPDYRPPAADRADACAKGDIDIAGMQQEEGEKAADRYDRFTAITAGCPTPTSWDQIREKHPGNIEAARTEFHNQPAVRALRESKDKDAVWWDVEDFLCSREEYIQRARDRALPTFALVKDGSWYEKGEMGWWGVVHDEKDQQRWNEEFASLISGLPEDTLLTVVDCHI